MKTHADKKNQPKTRSTANRLADTQSGEGATLQLADKRTEALSQQTMQEAANNSAGIKQLKAFQDMADGTQSGQPVAQPMMRRRGNDNPKKEEPDQKPKSKPQSSEPKKDYLGISSLAGGTHCYRFSTFLKGEEPNTGHYPFRDDDEGGVSLTLDPSKTPKGQIAKGRWKATYVLKKTTDLYICAGKQNFERLLRQDPDRLCYTDREAELKCSAAQFYTHFDIVQWEKHQPEDTETKEEKKREPEEEKKGGGATSEGWDDWGDDDW